MTYFIKNRKEQTDNNGISDCKFNGESISLMSKKDTKNVSNEEVKKSGSIEPIAWIILIGESLHNLLDGLSIGCAFSQGLVGGSSLSIAVLCDEFPHKLGKFIFLDFFDLS